MRTKIILLLLLITTYNCYASSGISRETAKTVAETYYRYSTTYSNATGRIDHIDKDANGNVLYYIVDMDKTGFVIVSGTTVANPIIGFSTHGNYKAIPQSGVEDYLFNLHNHLSQLYRLKITPQEKVTAQWTQLSSGLPMITTRSASSVSPLLSTTWNQSPYYNDYCPGGSVTGCVATAMAQIMKYWNYPATGTGSYSYSESPYGTMSFNFDSTINWSLMPASVSSSTPTNETDAVALLMYQLGVSVAMDYSPSGSGAYVLQSEDPGGPCAQYSYVNYFGYNSGTIQGLVQANYTTTAWDSIIDVELSNSRPIEYVGFGSDGGHTWVVDGYNTSGLYDMNWGWGGLDNGYFALDDLDPSGIPLGSENAMLIGIEPGTVQTTCSEPTSLAANSITTSGAAVSWTGSGSPKSYNLNYQVSGASSWTSVTGITSTNYTLSGLAAGTTYNIEVQQVCSSTESSSFTSAVSFSTTQPSCNTPTSLAAGSITTSSAVASWVGSGSPKSYTLNYQVSGASSWTSVTGITSTSYTLSGLAAGTTYNIEVQQVCSSTESSSFTSAVFFNTAQPSCNTPTSLAAGSITTSSAIVSWTGSGSPESYILSYRVSGASSWTSVSNITSESYSLDGLAAGTTYNIEVQQVCSSTESSSFTSTVSFNTTQASCNTPTSLAAGSITTSNTLISWVGSGSPESYTLNYRVSGASSWTSVTGITSESYSLDGLAAGTTYNIEVQQVCSSTESSSFTSTVSFSTTQASCNTPTSLAVGSITTSNALITWVGSGSPESYTLNYQKSGASSWTSITGITSESYSLDGLAAGTTYNIEVQQLCSSTESSSFTSAVSFSTTQTSCNTPASLAAGSITTSNALISWVGSGSPESYTLNYRVSGASSWTSVTDITSESYSLDGLAAGTTYNIEVQQVCSSTESSSFTSTVSFSTTLPTCDEPTSLTAGSITISSAVVSWEGSGSPESYTLNYQESGASSWTSITGITSESYSLDGLVAGTTYNIEVQQVCSSSESSSFTGTASFNTDLSYCTSSGTSTSEYIKDVQFGSIDNTISSNTGGYQNYTNLSTDITEGTSYKMIVTPGFTGTSYTEYWSVFIDYNHTGDFELVREGKGTGVLSGSISVPVTSIGGSTRMRIIMHRGSYINSACTTFTDGDVQDYTVVISGSSSSKIDLQPNGDDSSGVEQVVGEIAVNVFPNPTSTVLNIKYLNPIDITNITLVDATGKILLESPSKLDVLDFSKYAAGWYILVITGSDGSVSKNLITVVR